MYQPKKKKEKQHHLKREHRDHRNASPATGPHSAGAGVPMAGTWGHLTGPQGQAGSAPKGSAGREAQWEHGTPTGHV